MSLGLQVTIKPRDLAKITKQEQRDIKRGIDRAIGRVGSLGKQVILQRTEKGRGIDGPFPSYSGSLTKGFWKGDKDKRGSGYLAYRKYELEKVKPSKVNLNATGQMLRSMQVRQVNSRTAEIYFDNPEAAKKAAFNDRTRPFFGFNQKEEDRLVALFRREIDK